MQSGICVSASTPFGPAACRSSSVFCPCRVVLNLGHSSRRRAATQFPAECTLVLRDGRLHTGAMPVVSVVLIFLNEERFLEEAVRGVCEQTLTDWELVLVDDGSTDRSRAIARDLAAQDNRIRYIDHPGHQNRGAAASRNLGAAHTTAPYIAFIDADDYMSPKAGRASRPPKEHAGRGDGQRCWFRLVEVGIRLQLEQIILISLAERPTTP